MTDPAATLERLGEIRARADAANAKDRDAYDTSLFLRHTWTDVPALLDVIDVLRDVIEKACTYFEGKVTDGEVEIIAQALNLSPAEAAALRWALSKEG